MGKGNNNDHYNHPVSFTGYTKVVSTPSIIHTSGLVTTTPKTNHYNYAAGFSGGSNSSGYHTCGIVTTTPLIKPVVSHSSKPNQGQNKHVKVQNKSVITYSSKPNQVQSYETTSKIKQVNKQTGNYQNVTQKAKVSNSNYHKERGTGQVGVKNEIKKTSTVRVGNRSGYTEYHTEQRVRKVDFGNGGSNKRLTRGGY